jgi:hypothetical protein
LIQLVQSWLRAGGRRWAFAHAKGEAKSVSYQVINNLLRVIRYGREIKITVDTAITRCNEYQDIVDSIEDARQRAEDASVAGDTRAQESFIDQGMVSLKRYFFLIKFAAYLNETEADTRKGLHAEGSYEAFVRQRPGNSPSEMLARVMNTREGLTCVTLSVFRTIEKELDNRSMATLTPLSKFEDGSALSDEVQDVVARRNGRILSAQTILK